jgi:hypothetical protein
VYADLSIASWDETAEHRMTIRPAGTTRAVPLASRWPLAELGAFDERGEVRQIWGSWALTWMAKPNKTNVKPAANSSLILFITFSRWIIQNGRS